MKECPICKTMLEDDELFCHECGTKQEIKEVAVSEDETVTPIERKCIHCGETIEEDSAFCPFCGKPQAMEEVKEEEPIKEERSEKEDSPAPQKETAEGKQQKEEIPTQETQQEEVSTPATPEVTTKEKQLEEAITPITSEEPVEEKQPEETTTPITSEEPTEEKQLEKEESQEQISEPKEKDEDLESIENSEESNEDDSTEHHRGGGLWKFLLCLIIVAGLGAGAYFLFFNKSPEQKAAEAAQADYKEKVDECRNRIKKADNFPELLATKELLTDVKDMDDIHGSVMPEVYNRYHDLKKLYNKMLKKQRKEYIELANQMKDMEEYKTAYDLYNEAAEALPDDEGILQLRDNTAERMGFLDVIDVRFANYDRDGTNIDEVGSTLYASNMRYLFPQVVYNSLMPEGHESERVELYYKIYNPDGSLRSGNNSPYGYTNKDIINVVVGEKNRHEWLNGWGHADISNYEAGEYKFELYHRGRKIYSKKFYLY